MSFSKLIPLKLKAARLLLPIVLLVCAPVFTQTNPDQGKRGIGLKVEAPKQPTPQPTDKTEINKPELVIQTGHSLGVTAVTFSPDNRLLASGSIDNTVKVWDLESGREIHTFTGHKGWVTTVAFAPDSQLLASGSKDMLLKVWSINNERELQTFEGHAGEISAIAFDPAGQYLASGGTDNAL